MFKPFLPTTKPAPAPAQAVEKVAARSGFVGFGMKPTAQAPAAEPVIQVEEIDPADLPNFLTETVPGPDSPTRMGRSPPRR